MFPCYVQWAVKRTVILPRAEGGLNRSFLVFPSYTFWYCCSQAQTPCLGAGQSRPGGNLCGFIHSPCNDCSRTPWVETPAKHMEVMAGTLLSCPEDISILWYIEHFFYTTQKFQDTSEMMVTHIDSPKQYEVWILASLCNSTSSKL